MKTKFLGIALAVALLLAPVAFIAPVRAQTEGIEIGIPSNIWDTESAWESLGQTESPFTHYTTITYGGNTYYIYANSANNTIQYNEADRGIYDADGNLVGHITSETTGVLYVEFPEDYEELVVQVNLPVYYTTATIGEDTYNVHVSPDDTTVTIEGIVFTISGTSLSGTDTDGTAYTGTLGGGRYEVKTESGFSVQVTLSATGEPVNNATVAWAGSEVQTDPFGGAWLTAPFVESETNMGKVEAIKVYSQESIERSAYGVSDYPIVVIPYDLSNPSEFLAWWEHFALTEEAQAMYEAAEILGDWGANLGTEGVTVWSNIFGPKGGSLAEFIRGFPQFMVDRGAALEATQNMLDTIWALFTLLPAFVLASPQILQTAPMRMLQFWPVLFMNLDKVLAGISQMVIDLGVFMTSLAPSMLLLLPDMVAKIPEVVPQALDIGLTTLETFIDVIPALAQYGAAALAAIPAFFIQMLQALFYNGPAIFDVALSESIATVANLFRSWPLFPAGIAAGILAVAPALMTLPAYAPFVVGGQMLENLAASLSTYMQQLREMPSRLLDSVMSLAEVPGLIARYGIVILYLAITVPLLLPAILIATFVLWMSLVPLGILTLSLALAPFAALLMFVPIVGWAWDIIWACWMGVSVFASWAAMLPGYVFGLVDTIAWRLSQIAQIFAYPCVWFFDGLEGLLDTELALRIRDIFVTLIPLILNMAKAAGSATAEGAQTTAGMIAPFLEALVSGAIPP